MHNYLVNLYTNYLNWQNLWRDEIKPLMPYPWIYIATFVFPVINRCVNNYHISEYYVLVWVKVHMNVFMITIYVGMSIKASLPLATCLY